MPRAFVIRPFGRKRDESGREIDFEHVHDALITPALSLTDVSGGTTGDIVEPGNIRSDMFSAILAADLVICDITIHNANVFYELGIRHALRKRSTILLRGHPFTDAIPFDLVTDRYIEYSLDQPEEGVDELEAAILNALDTDREVDSPVFLMLPSLTEADPDASTWIVPKELTEDVELALAARSSGWLRLLAVEVKGQLFEAKALAQIAKAQTRIGDLDGALDSWERIRDADPKDVEANLALANVYERLFRRDGYDNHLTKSEQAVERTLSSKPRPRDKAEAMGMKARNLKTRWRLRFQDATTVKDRRALAMRPELVTSYEYYRQAFLHDLNAYWPGLAALQMGVIAEAFSHDPDWAALFDTDREAALQREEIAHELAQLKYLVPAAVEANLAQGKKIDVWLQITQADVLFLTSDRLPRILHAYERAIPAHEAFAWDSARGQLELFRDLGVRAEVADRVIENMDRHLGSSGIEAAEEAPPERVILFAGHRIDDDHTPEPVRALLADEARAKTVIRAQLEPLIGADRRVEAFAPATPGPNLLFHEVCQELGVDSTMCLPVRQREFARSAFGRLDDWKARFLGLLKQRRTLELAGTTGLPAWLVAAGIDQWERGNRWVMEHGLTRRADSVHLLALWDGATSVRSGDVDHMVALARESGVISVQIIDANQWLE